MAVFLDRDGTLIEDRDYLRDPAGVRVFPGVARALNRLRNAGHLLVVVTNQSGIARGLMTEADYQSVTDELIRRLAEDGARLDAFYHCPAVDDVHPDRKPNPGMYLRAAEELSIDLGASWVVGDSLRDVIAGQRAGCENGILVRTGKPLPEDIAPWHVADDLAAAADIILCPERK